MRMKMKMVNDNGGAWGSMFEICIRYFGNYMIWGSKIGLGAFFEVQFKIFNSIVCMIILVYGCGNQLSICYQMFCTCYAIDIV